MTQTIEKVARAIEAVVMERLSVGVSDSAAHHMARAAIEALAANVTDEMLSSARIPLGLDSYDMPDENLRRAISAAIRAALEE